MALRRNTIELKAVVRKYPIFQHETKLKKYSEIVCAASTITYKKLSQDLGNV